MVKPAALVSLTALAFALLDVSPGAAQSRAAGVVRRFAARDSQPAAGLRIVLHRIGRDRQGPLDSTVSDRSGRFHFDFPTDTTALHLLTARYAGVQYFSEPVGTNPSRPDTQLVIAVYDTSSSAPITLDARHIVVSAPADDGSRSVVELVSIANRGGATRVPGRDSSIVWSLPLPRGVFGFAAAEGDLSAGAVERRGDSVVVVAPIAPGERQLAMEYLLPPGIPALAIRFDSPTPLVNVLLEEAEASVTVPSLEPADSAAVIQGRDFRRWSGSMPAGTVLRVVFPVRGLPGRDALAAMVAGVALALVAAMAVAWRRPIRASVRPTTADGLLDAIAALDLRYAGRRLQVPDAEWGEFERRRAELKQLLSDTLAERRSQA